VLSYFLAPFVDCSKLPLGIVVLGGMNTTTTTDLTWTTPPECPAEVSYAADDYWVYRRTVNSGNEVYERRDWDFTSDCDGSLGEKFEPWNSKPGGEGWKECGAPQHEYFFFQC
jgi:hypothetical protein